MPTRGTHGRPREDPRSGRCQSANHCSAAPLRLLPAHDHHPSRCGGRHGRSGPGGTAEQPDGKSGAGRLRTGMGLGARVGLGSSVGVPESRAAVPIGYQDWGRAQEAGGRSPRLRRRVDHSSTGNGGTWMKPGRPDTSKSSNFYFFVSNRKPSNQCP